MTQNKFTPETWLDMYGDLLYRYSLTRVRNPDVAEDLVQETLLAAWKSKENYAGRSSEQTWLIGILKHKIIDYFRKHSRENSEAFDECSVEDEESAFFDQQGHWQIDFSTWSKPDQTLEQEQFLIVLQKCLDRLPPNLAQLFFLREVEGLESEEICKILSISTLNNFWVSMSRVRVKLRYCLDENWIKHEA